MCATDTNTRSSPCNHAPPIKSVTDKQIESVVSERLPVVPVGDFLPATFGLVQRFLQLHCGAIMRRFMRNQSVGKQTEIRGFLIQTPFCSYEKTWLLNLLVHLVYCLFRKWERHWRSRERQEFSVFAWSKTRCWADFPNVPMVAFNAEVGVMTKCRHWSAEHQNVKSHLVSIANASSGDITGREKQLNLDAEQTLRCLINSAFLLNVYTIYLFQGDWFTGELLVENIFQNKLKECSDRSHFSCQALLGVHVYVGDRKCFLPRGLSLELHVRMDLPSVVSSRLLREMRDLSVSPGALGGFHQAATVYTI